MANRLPNKLERLGLDFSENTNFTDVGFRELAEHIASSVDNLSLRFSNNTNFTDVGLRALARSIPHKLTYVELYFDANSNFSDAALYGLGAHMPSCVLDDVHHEFNFREDAITKMADLLGLEPSVDGDRAAT